MVVMVLVVVVLVMVLVLASGVVVLCTLLRVAVFTQALLSFFWAALAARPTHDGEAVSCQEGARRGVGQSGTCRLNARIFDCRREPAAVRALRRGHRSPLREMQHADHLRRLLPDRPQ